MTSVINVSVDDEKRSRAEAVFSEVGLTTSAAVNLFICAVAIHGGIPFPINVGETSPFRIDRSVGPSAVRIGIADGKYDFRSDFDDAFDAMDGEVAELFS